MYEYLVNKLFIVVIASNTWLGTDFNVPRFDLIILDNGEEVKCRVEDIENGFIRANTKNGEIKIIRQMNVNAARDIIETGIIKTKRYSGKISYFGADFMEIETYAGTIRVNTALVRKVILAQEPSLKL